VDLGHQRAGCIQNGQATLGGLVFYALGDAMGAEDRNRMGGTSDKSSTKIAPLPSGFRRRICYGRSRDAHRPAAIFLQRALHDLDRTHDPGAKATRLREKHFHGRPLTKLHRAHYLLRPIA